MRVELQAGLLQNRGYGDELRSLVEPGRVSPSTHRPWPTTMVSETWRVAQSSVYALRARLGEGHRKVKARLAPKKIRMGKNRVLRLLRAHGPLAGGLSGG